MLAHSKLFLPVTLATLARPVTKSRAQNVVALISEEEWNIAREYRPDQTVDLFSPVGRTRNP